MSISAIHIHVSEREVAHTWPDGQKDDAAWEDCTFCAAIEFARLCHDAGIPATHAEAELLRDASGRKPTGGTNVGDVIRGLQGRYGWLTGYVQASSYAELRTTLVPGTAAVSQGRLAAFLFGHSLRRWDPGFVGGHAVLLINDGDPSGPWWCDPLAPKGQYRGERVTWSEVRTYVLGLGGTHLVAPLLAPALPDTGTGEEMTVPIGNDAGYLVRLSVGDQLYSQPTAAAELVKVSTAQTVNGYFYTGTGYIAIGITTGGDQVLAYVRSQDVTVTPQPTDCAAAIAAAVEPVKHELAGVKDRLVRIHGLSNVT